MSVEVDTTHGTMRLQSSAHVFRAHCMGMPHRPGHIAGKLFYSFDAAMAELANHANDNKVEIIESRDDATFVYLGDGRYGWVSREEVN